VVIDADDDDNDDDNDDYDADNAGRRSTTTRVTYRQLAISQFQINDIAI